MSFDLVFPKPLSGGIVESPNLRSYPSQIRTLRDVSQRIRDEGYFCSVCPAFESVNIGSFFNSQFGDKITSVANKLHTSIIDRLHAEYEFTSTLGENPNESVIDIGLVRKYKDVGETREPVFNLNRGQRIGTLRFESYMPNGWLIYGHGMNTFPHMGKLAQNLSKRYYRPVDVFLAHNSPLRLHQDIDEIILARFPLWAHNVNA